MQTNIEISHVVKKYSNGVMALNDISFLSKMFTSFAGSLSYCEKDGCFMLVKTIIVSAFPVSLFVSLCSVALPGMIDIRLFYLLAAILFGFNGAYVGSADAAPFYLITSGDLIRLIWVHPKWPFRDAGSIFANGTFLIGSGLIFGSLLFLKHRFWRSE